MPATSSFPTIDIRDVCALCAHSTGIDVTKDKPYQIGYALVDDRGTAISKKIDLNVDTWMSYKMRKEAADGTFPHAPYLERIKTDKPNVHNLRLWQASHNKDEANADLSGAFGLGDGETPIFALVWSGGFETSLLRSKGFKIAEHARVIDLRAIYALRHKSTENFYEACEMYDIETPRDEKGGVVSVDAETKAKFLLNLAVAMEVVDADVEFVSEDEPAAE